MSELNSAIAYCHSKEMLKVIADFKNGVTYSYKVIQLVPIKKNALNFMWTSFQSMLKFQL